MKSGRLAVNVLIDLYKEGKDTKATFDFLNRTIEPQEAISKESIQLMNDYIDWLPDHFDKHDCDLAKLEKLEVTIWTDFKIAFVPPGMDNCKEFTVSTLTNWKADGREERTIKISQTEIIKENFLKLRIPEVK